MKAVITQISFTKYFLTPVCLMGGCNDKIHFKTKQSIR